MNDKTRANHSPDELDTLTSMTADRVLEVTKGLHTSTRMLGTCHALAKIIAEEHDVGDVDNAFRAAMQVLRMKVALFQSERERDADGVAVG